MIDPSAIWPPILLTLQLATLVTLILLVVSTPIAWWLARSDAKWKESVAAVVALPLVLPPTVLGFYLLLALGPSGPGGALAGLWGGRTMAFTFTGLVIGSVIFSLPFVVQPLRIAFEAIGSEPVEAARSLGASPLEVFRAVELPLARPGYITGAVMGFAHTVGEFGVVLMIGGNIPGQTRVLSVALFEHVEAAEFAAAHRLAGGMVAFSFVVITLTMLINRRAERTARS